MCRRNSRTFTKVVKNLAFFFAGFALRTKMLMKLYVHEHVLKRRYLNSFTMGEHLSMFIMRVYLSSEHALTGENLRMLIGGE